MKVRAQDEWLVFSSIEPFDLYRTLTSGQTFRWVRNGASFEGVVGDSLLEMRQERDQLWARTFPVALQLDLVTDYFALKFPIQDAIAKLSQDEHLARALTRQPGIRILRQQPWECMASFILAINKSIPQIEKTIVALCEKLGPKVRVGNKIISLFPGPEIIANTPEAVLRSTKMGFRARYLVAAAQKLIQEHIDLVQYRQKTYAQAKSFLMEFYGIGPKVADCICLFSLGHQQAFPVDVWIQRAMKPYCGVKERTNLVRVAEIAREKFGNFAGLAQQYLYHDIRSLARKGA